MLGAHQAIAYDQSRRHHDVHDSAEQNGPSQPQSHDGYQDNEDHPIADVYMNDAMDDASPTPLAGHHQHQQQQQPLLSSPVHYQQPLEHRNMALGSTTINKSNSSNTNPTVSPSRPLQQTHHRMQRMNSSSDDSARDGGGAATTASQNSSRDWGWFEEWGVGTGSEGGGRGDRRGGGGGGGFSPHGGLHHGPGGMGDDDDAGPIYRMVVGLDPRDGKFKPYGTVVWDCVLVCECVHLMLCERWRFLYVPLLARENGDSYRVLRFPFFIRQ